MDDLTDFAYPPEGGRVARWLGGVVLALTFIVCGVLDLRSGHTAFFGHRGQMQLSGEAARAMASAYIALGALFHFHWFWGLHDRLWPWSQRLKTVALLVFVPCFVWALYRMLWV